jgi:hypothetical protein
MMAVAAATYGRLSLEAVIYRQFPDLPKFSKGLTSLGVIIRWT